MMKQGTFVFVVLDMLALLLAGCVEPFRPSLEEQDTRSLLVVEGLITDEPGPFRVHLTSSIPVYNEEYNLVRYYPPVSGAAVRIADDKGSDYLLYEQEAGWYETLEKNVHGIPGNTYILLIYHYSLLLHSTYLSYPSTYNN